MPTYDYKCRDCDYQFEKFQKMSAEPLKECPRCGGAVRKLISGGAGIVFKGSGFYVNDYAKKDKKESIGSKSETVSQADKKADTQPKSDEKKKTEKIKKTEA